MTIRSTYALDEATSRCIKNLARQWHVSQAEVIRRSVKDAAERDVTTLAPADVVAHYATAPLARSQDQTRAAVSRQRADRHEDDERRMRAAKP